MTKPDEYLLTGCLWLAGELGWLRLRRWWGVAPPLLRRVVLDMTPLSQMCGPSYQPHKWAQRLPAIKHNKLIPGTNRQTCISSSIFCFRIIEVQNSKPRLSIGAVLATWPKILPQGGFTPVTVTRDIEKI